MAAKDLDPMQSFRWELPERFGGVIRLGGEQPSHSVRLFLSFETVFC